MPLPTNIVAGQSGHAGLHNDTNTTVNTIEASYKKIAPRVVAATLASNTYTPNASTSDITTVASPAADFTVASPGAGANGQQLTMRITSGATGYTPTWNAIYTSSGIAALPTTALPVSKTVTLSFVYDTGPSKWVLMAYDSVGY